MKAPWDFSTPKDGQPTRPNVPTAEGEELGREVARLVAPRVAADREQFPNGLPACDECAFVAGTEPNRCVATLMDAIKCAIECVPFYCHKGLIDESKPRRLCAGWIAAAGSPLSSLPMASIRTQTGEAAG